jgi:hypothetical protein
MPAPVVCVEVGRCLSGNNFTYKMLSDEKTSQDLTVMAGGARGILSAVEICLLNPDAMKLDHDCFRRSCHSRSCNLGV